MAELDQTVKHARMSKYDTIDINIVRDDPLVADLKPFEKSEETMTKIAKNSTRNFNEANVSDKPKFENNEENKAKKQDNEEVKTFEKNLEVIELDLSDQDDQNVVNQRKPRSSGYNRWGKQKDVQLFQTLQNICSQQGISIEDFLNDDLELTEDHQKVLKDLKYQVHWRRRASAMLQRIRMLAKDQSLSHRQCNELRRLAAKARRSKTKLVVEDIAYMFPGKLVATLESWLNDSKNKKK